MGGRARGQIWRYAPQYRRPRHFHSEPELNLVTAGSGTFGAGSAEIIVARGDLLFWLPGEEHELLDASANFDLFVVGLAPEWSERVLGVNLASALGGPRRTRLAPVVTERLHQLCAGTVGGDTSALEQRVGDWWRDAHVNRLESPEKHPLTRRTLASVLERPELGRAAVAHLVRGHPSEVSRHFRDNLGITFTAFRARQRLLRFIELVDRGATHLAAALDAGFGSYSQCHRVFRRALGCSPRGFFCADVRRAMSEAFHPIGDLVPPG